MGKTGLSFWGNHWEPHGGWSLLISYPTETHISLSSALLPSSPVSAPAPQLGKAICWGAPHLEWALSSVLDPSARLCTGVPSGSSLAPTLDCGTWSGWPCPDSSGRGGGGAVSSPMAYHMPLHSQAPGHSTSSTAPASCAAIGLRCYC